MEPRSPRARPSTFGEGARGIYLRGCAVSGSCCGRLGLALVLSTAIGLEREWRQKSAGLRTYTLVGLGSALFLLVGEYGFFDELEPGHVVLDPSRVAAQIVSGIGFIGGGLIFVRQRRRPRAHHRGRRVAGGGGRDGGRRRARGAGDRLDARLPARHHRPTRCSRGGSRARRGRRSPLRVTYVDGRGVLREVLSRVTGAGFDVSGARLPPPRRGHRGGRRRGPRPRAGDRARVASSAPSTACCCVNAADADPD